MVCRPGTGCCIRGSASVALGRAPLLPHRPPHSGTVCGQQLLIRGFDNLIWVYLLDHPLIIHFFVHFFDQNFSIKCRGAVFMWV